MLVRAAINYTWFTAGKNGHQQVDLICNTNSLCRVDLPNVYFKWFCKTNGYNQIEKGNLALSFCLWIGTGTIKHLKCYHIDKFKVSHNSHLCSCSIEVVRPAAQFWRCGVAVWVWWRDCVCVSRWRPDAPVQHPRREDVCLHSLPILVIEQIRGTEHWGSPCICNGHGRVFRALFRRRGRLAMSVGWEPGR